VIYLLDTNAISALMRDPRRNSPRPGQAGSGTTESGTGSEGAGLKITRYGRGQPLDENDLRIAATALAIAATLVSRDGDFQWIEGFAVVVP